MIKVGDIVECRYFNTPDRKFYGEVFQAKVIEVYHKYYYKVDPETSRYIVKRADRPWNTTLKRKEIKRVVK